MIRTSNYTLFCPGNTNYCFIVNPLQPENAAFPIVVTEFGIVKLPVNPLQPEKAPTSIEVTE